MKTFKFTPILGWSASRYDLFTQCKRQYYYNYYAKYDPEISEEKIHRLKAMTSVALETGNIVHDVTKTLLERLQRNQSGIDRGRFLDYTRKVTDEYCQARTFREIYYREIPRLDIDGIFGKVSASLQNFLDSDRFSWLMEKALQSSRDWIIEPPGYGETRINGQKAYCKVDFLFPLADRLYIIDWKTGKPNDEKHEKQLRGYTTWAAYHFDREPGLVTPLIAYLYPRYRERELAGEDMDIRQFARQIKSESAQMFRFCKDIKNNIPREKEQFTMNRTRLCDYCNYLELCR